MALFLEWVVIIYHIIFTVVIGAVLIDYILATEKLTKLREFLDNDAFTPIFGMQLSIIITAAIAAISDITLLMHLAQAVTILVVLGILVSLAFGLICSGVESIRKRNLARKE